MKAPVKVIDLETWNRRDHYRWYRAYASPHLALTAEVEFTGLVRGCKAAGRSLFADVMHALATAANEVAPLRQRIRVVDGAEQIVEHPVVHPGFTVGLSGERFGFAMTPLVAERAAFSAAVREVSAVAQAHDGLTPFDGQRDDLLYFSCLPWVRFTHVEHSLRGGDDCTPRIAWGRLAERAGRWTAPVNVLGHHALVDGAHLGRFFQRLEALAAG